MRKAVIEFWAVVGVIVLSMTAGAVAQGPSEWVIENDHPYDFEVTVRPSGGRPQPLLLTKNGGIGKFSIGRELHDLRTVQITANGRDARDHKPRDIKAWTSGRDITLLSEIVTPLKIGNTEIKRLDGSTIYEAMPDFPVSEKFDPLVSDLKQSAWKGQFADGNGVQQEGVLQLNGKVGEARQAKELQDIPGDRTTLQGVKYSAAESTIYIAAAWDHARRATGVMALKVDSERPWLAEGFYQVRGRRDRAEGTARRLKSNIPVVVLKQSKIVDSKLNVVKNVAEGQRLVVLEAQRNWCWVSEPGGNAIGWIDSDSISTRRDRPAPAAGEFSIGVQLEPLAEIIASQLKLNRGMIVAHVVEDSPADKAEFKVNDIILRAGDKDIKVPEDLIAAVKDAKVKQLTIVVLRGGTETTLTVLPARGDRPAPAAGELSIGVQLEPLPEIIASQLKLNRGMVVAHVVEDSPAAKAEFKVSDIILRAGDKDIKQPEDLIAAVNDAKDKQLTIIVLRGGTETTLTVLPAMRQDD